MKKPISLIAAISNNNAIGKDGGIPWYIPADMRHFRLITTGDGNNAVGYGRATAETLVRPLKPGEVPTPKNRQWKALPKRANFMLTRNADYPAPPDVTVCTNFDELLSIPQSIDAIKKIFLCGGEDIYFRGMPFADEMEITHVDIEIEEPFKRFPPILLDEWHVTSSQWLTDPDSGLRYRHASYRRRMH